MNELIEIVESDLARSENGIMTKVKYFNWIVDSGDLVPEKFEIPVPLLTQTRVKINNQIDLRQFLSHGFPTGGAGSFLKTSWLRKFGNSIIYQSVSPDCYTGFLYALTNTSFLQVDLHVVMCGSHPKSSINLMKTRGDDFFHELSLPQKTGHPVLRERYKEGFPTTWLARFDALFQVKLLVLGESHIDWRDAIREFYKTTPHYVSKVYKMQRKAFPEFGVWHRI